MAVASGTGGVRLVMLSDTHLPVRARELPAEVWSAVDAADGQRLTVRRAPHRQLLLPAPQLPIRR
ncbi:MULTISPECIES: hypothetical protein [unclassified Frankia]